MPANPRPRLIAARFAGRCGKCNAEIFRGDAILFYPTGIPGAGVLRRVVGPCCRGERGDPSGTR